MCDYAVSIIWISDSYLHSITIRAPIGNPPHHQDGIYYIQLSACYFWHGCPVFIVTTMANISILIRTKLIVPK